MPQQILINTLSAVGFLPKEAKDRLGSTLQYGILAKGRQPVIPGRLADKVWFVIKGLIKWYYVDDNDKKHIYHFVSENEFTMVERSIYNNEKAHTFMEVIEQTEVLSLSQDEFKYLLSTFKEIYEIKDKLRAKDLANKRKLYRIVRMDEAERYDAFIDTFPHLFRKSGNKIEYRMGVQNLLQALNISLSTLKRSVRFSRHP